MKKLGLIGGMGPESTTEYYKGIVYGFQNRLGVDNQFPELIIESIDIFKMLSLCNSEQYDLLAQYLHNAVEHVYNSGAEFAALAANTPHIVFDSIQKASPIPLISIVKATRDRVFDLGLKKVGLIGTKFTMQKDFFRAPFLEQSIDIYCPSKTNQAIIDRIIVDELERGVITTQSHTSIVSIIENMIDEHGIEGIIIGCTELPLIVKESDIKTIYLDTMQIHVNAIIDSMLCEQ